MSTTDEHAAIYAEVWAILLDSYTEAGAAIWMLHGNRNLDGARPIDLLKEGQGARVRDAAYAIEGEG